MAENNTKNSQNDESLDDIQKQVSDLMGPPPLQNYKSSDQPTSAKSEKKVSIDIQENQPEPPEKVLVNKSTQPESEEEIDKSITIEEAEKLADEKTVLEEQELSKNEKADSIYSPKVQNAVADIEAREGNDDDLPVEPTEPKITKKKLKIREWLKGKRLLKIALAALIVIILIILLVPPTRYFVLNAAGVRASLSLNVSDAQSLQPISGVEVSVNGATGLTNQDGSVTLNKVKLGSGNLVLKKRSFAPIEKNITVGWGSNPLDEKFAMEQVGTNYSFVITDFLSGQPIEGAKLIGPDSVALSSKQGVAQLKTESAAEKITFKVQAQDYKTFEVSVPAGAVVKTSVNLVPSQPNVFISNRSGTYDLYARYVDGSDEKILLPGSGKEMAGELSILTKPKSNKVAFVSGRDGQKNAQGYLLSNLYIVDTDKKSVSKVEGSLSEKIQLIAWSGDRLIFVKVAAGPSGEDAGRQRIISYNLASDSWQEIARSNSFNDLIVFNNSIYYANSGPGGKLYKIGVDGSAKKIIENQETWAIRWLDENNILINTANRKWQKINLLNDNKTESASNNIASDKFYVKSPNGDYTAFIERRDGKAKLIVKSKDPTKPEKIYAVRTNFSYPVEWLNDKYLVAKVYDASESASYVVNVSGGELKKIGDEAQTAQTGRWYYF